MSSTGYSFAKVYADWVSQNQRQVAMLRLGDSLSKLCEQKFRIPISAKSLQKWSILSFPMLIDLESAEASSEDIFDATLPLRKKDIIRKYMGDKEADLFEDRYSLHYDAHEMMARVHTFVYMRVNRM